MNTCWCRFNIYLALVLGLAAVCGCRTSGESNPKKQVSTLRFHLETTRDGTKANEPVPIYREKPVMVNVELTPFLTEANVAEAKVIDVIGGFALRIPIWNQGQRARPHLSREARDGQRGANAVPDRSKRGRG